MSGIELRQARIVADNQSAIVEAINDLRGGYDYVFTCGGIGPTHDDITADAIAAAFDVPIDHDPRAMELLESHYRARDMVFTDARKRMARIPKGAELIANPVSVAPGFRLENVYVLAGVPSIFRAMLGEISPTLATGVPVLSITIDCPHGEGTIGGALAAIQENHSETVIGSYPRFDGKHYSTRLVVRSRDQAALEKAADAVGSMLANLA